MLFYQLKANEYIFLDCMLLCCYININVKQVFYINAEFMIMKHAKVELKHENMHIRHIYSFVFVFSLQTLISL